MVIFVVGAVWLVCCTIAAVLARWSAVKVAEKNGYSALTMPMKYHVILIMLYLALVYGSGIALAYCFLN